MGNKWEVSGCAPLKDARVRGVLYGEWLHATRTVLFTVTGTTGHGERHG